MSVKDSKLNNGRVKTRFRSLRAEKEVIEGRVLTYEIISDETGVSIGSIKRWNNNEVSQFAGDQIVVFCNYFNCSIADLLMLDVEDEAEGQLKEPLAA